jgi:competence protein ComEA
MLRPLKPEAKVHQPLWLLRRGDQAILGGVAIAAVAGLALLWYLRGGASGELLPFDDLSQGEIRFVTDINQADWPELCELPGIGATLARRIVEHRQSHGPFRSLDDLRRVRGIGPKTLERIRPYLAPLSKSTPL